MLTEYQRKALMEAAKMPSKQWDRADSSLDDYDPPAYERDRGSIAREEEMCELLRRQVELLEILCRNQGIALAKLTGGKANEAAPSPAPSMDKQLTPARTRPDKE
jgi:hypothetical protein